MVTVLVPFRMGHRPLSCRSSGRVVVLKDYVALCVVKWERTNIS